MKLLPLIQALAASGGTMDQVVALVAAHDAQEEARLAARREGNAERQRKARLSRMSRVTERDTLSLDKEKPPTPPKEINPTPERCAAPARTREDLDRIEASCREAAHAVENPSPSLLDLRPVLAWLDAGFSLEEDILPVIRAKAPPRLASWSYFTRALQDALDASHKAVSAAREAARNPRSGEGGSRRPNFSDPVTRALLAMAESGELAAMETDGGHHG